MAAMASAAPAACLRARLPARLVAVPALSAGRPAPQRLMVCAADVEVAAGSPINLSIQKDVEKGADTVKISELTKPVTAYCRCWRSETFPLCNGAHVKFNKATGDNVGPLVLKK
eukprot:SM000154S01408  [mRNA]  locus=s154:328834:329734:+ [translate_table: standard]